MRKVWDPFDIQGAVDVEGLRLLPLYHSSFCSCFRCRLRCWHRIELAAMLQSEGAAELVAHVSQPLRRCTACGTTCGEAG